MAKRRRSKKPRKPNNARMMVLLPLFIVTVCVVFSFLFTVMMVPFGQLTADIKFVFIMLLVVSTTVASAVSLIFYLFFVKGTLH
jgi:hypothetical protein